MPVEENGTTKLAYIKTKFGAHEGEALAGYLLSFSERYPEFALQDFFGATSAPGAKAREIQMADGETTEYKNRSPYLRYQILQTIASQPSVNRVVDIANAINTDVNTVARHLKVLHRKGILTYDAKEADKDFVSVT